MDLLGDSSSFLWGPGSQEVWPAGSIQMSLPPVVVEEVSRLFKSGVYYFYSTPRGPETSLQGRRRKGNVQSPKSSGFTFTQVSLNSKFLKTPTPLSPACSGGHGTDPEHPRQSSQVATVPWKYNKRHQRSKLFIL